MFLSAAEGSLWCLCVGKGNSCLCRVRYLLSELRTGKMSEGTISALMGRSESLQCPDGILPTRLYPLNDEVERVNLYVRVGNALSYVCVVCVQMRWCACLQLGSALFACATDALVCVSQQLNHFRALPRGGFCPLESTRTMIRWMFSRAGGKKPVGCVRG